LAALEDWDGSSTPEEQVFAAFAADLKAAQDSSTAALAGKRLNYEIAGTRSKVLAAARLAAGMEMGPYRQAFLDKDRISAAPETWAVIQRNGARLTPYYLLTAVDLKQSPKGGLERVAPDQAIFLAVLGRTLLVAGMVTALTLIL